MRPSTTRRRFHRRPRSPGARTAATKLRAYKCRRDDVIRPALRPFSRVDATSGRVGSPRTGSGSWRSRGSRGTRSGGPRRRRCGRTRGSGPQARALRSAALVRALGQEFPSLLVNAGSCVTPIGGPQQNPLEGLPVRRLALCATLAIWGLLRPVFAASRMVNLRVLHGLPGRSFPGLSSNPQARAPPAPAGHDCSYGCSYDNRYVCGPIAGLQCAMSYRYLRGEPGQWRQPASLPRGDREPRPPRSRGPRTKPMTARGPKRPAIGGAGPRRSRRRACRELEAGSSAGRRAPPSGPPAGQSRSCVGRERRIDSASWHTVRTTSAAGRTAVTNAADWP